jgi:hypothetical protein
MVGGGDGNERTQPGPAREETDCNLKSGPPHQVAVIECYVPLATRPRAVSCKQWSGRTPSPNSFPSIEHVGDASRQNPHADDSKQRQKQRIPAPGVEHDKPHTEDQSHGEGCRVEGGDPMADDLDNEDAEAEEEQSGELGQDFAIVAGAEQELQRKTRREQQSDASAQEIGCDVNQAEIRTVHVPSCFSLLLDPAAYCGWSEWLGLI